MDGRNTDFQSYLYAYAIGCLDKEDFIQLVEHLETGENFPWQELGEYQNLAALLPSFLHLEEPAPNVKDRVARKLYRLRETMKTEPKQKTMVEEPQQISRTKTAYHERMKTQITEAPRKPSLPIDRITIPDEEIAIPDEFKQPEQENRPSGVERPPHNTQIKGRAQQPARESFTQPDSPIKPIPLPPEDTTDSDEESKESFIINDAALGVNTSEVSTSFESDTSILDLPDEPAPAPPPVKKSSQPVNAFDLEEIRKKVVEKVELETDESVTENDKPVSGTPPWMLYAILAVSLVAIGIVYYLMNGRVTEVNSQLQEFKKETSETVQKNIVSSEMLQLAALKDTYTASLTGTSRFADAYGKFMFNASMKVGYVLLANLPPTGPEQGYVLWCEMNGQRLPVSEPLEFGNNGLKSEYSKITNVPQFQNGVELVFFVTLEKKGAKLLAPTRDKFIEGLLQY